MSQAGPLNSLADSDVVTSAIGTANQVLVNGTSATPEVGQITLTLAPTISITNIQTAPAVSSVVTTAFGASLTLGSSTQNMTGYDILLNISVTVTAATTSTLTLGVGSTSTPTTNTAVPSFTVVASTVYSLVAYVPNNYYVLVGSTGTPTVGSITVVAMAV